MAATTVNVYKTATFKSVAAYDSANGNDVINNLDIAIRVALTKDGYTVVDGTELFILPGKTGSYADGLDAASIVVFLQDTGSLVNGIEIIAKS